MLGNLMRKRVMILNLMLRMLVSTGDEWLLLCLFGGHRGDSGSCFRDVTQLIQN